MKNTYSIIVAINNRFSIVDNFLHHLESVIDGHNCEIVLVVDGPQDSNVCTAIHKKENLPRYNVVWLDKQNGYGIANNIGVNHSHSDFLLFLGSDVFPKSKSIELLFDTLIKQEDETIIQGLTLYPQTNRIQSTGHVFGHLINRHAFENRNINEIELPALIKRQAVSSTFYVMKKTVFNSLGQFDKFYYNAWEGMELSLKASLQGIQSLCARDAVAYHVRGGGRNDTYIDEEQQSVYFWCKWHDRIHNDLSNILAQQLSDSVRKNSYTVILVNQYRSWKYTLDEIKLNYNEIIQLYPRKHGKYIFETELPNAILSYPGSLLFACDNFQDVCSNAYSIQRRAGRGDIVIDLSGNLVRLT